MVNYILKKWFGFTNKEIKQIKKNFYEYCQGKQRYY